MVFIENEEDLMKLEETLLKYILAKIEKEGEKLICKYAKETFGSEFIFLTHYPRSERPMDTMPLGKEETHSFDLLFRGLEITTGGQRIHKFNELIENIKYKR